MKKLILVFLLSPIFLIAIKANALETVDKSVTPDIYNNDVNGVPPLISAVRQGKLDTIKELMERGESLNSKDKMGNTPLYWAAWDGVLEIVKLLISAGANVNEKNYNGDTPLHAAAFNEQLLSIKILIQNKADHKIKNNFGKTPQEMANDDGKILINKMTPFTLFNVALYDDTESINILIKQGADVNEKDQFGKTPLHWAALKGSQETSIILIEAGAYLNEKDKNQNTPLHFASYFKVNKDVVELLIDSGANVNEKNIDGLTPLFFATFWDISEPTKFLIEGGADVNVKSPEEEGATPLHWAASLGKTAIAKLLIEAHANVNEKTITGQTPLHWSAQRGFNQIVNLLLDNKADPNIKDNDGKTALDLASNDEVKKILSNQETSRATSPVDQTVLVGACTNSGIPGFFPPSCMDYYDSVTVEVMKNFCDANSDFSKWLDKCPTLESLGGCLNKYSTTVTWFYGSVEGTNPKESCQKENNSTWVEDRNAAEALLKATNL